MRSRSLAPVVSATRMSCTVCSCTNSPVSLQCQNGLPALRDGHSCHKWYPSQNSFGPCDLGTSGLRACGEDRCGVPIAISGIQNPPPPAPASSSSSAKSSANHHKSPPALRCWTGATCKRMHNQAEACRSAWYGFVNGIETIWTDR